LAKSLGERMFARLIKCTHDGFLHRFSQGSTMLEKVKRGKE
jgi:hypothetical protein